jgi:hypothetical protein
MFCIEDNKNTISEIFLHTFWCNNWRSIIDVVGRLCYFYHMALQVLKIGEYSIVEMTPTNIPRYIFYFRLLTMPVLGKIDSLTSFAQALYNISQRCQRLRLPRHIIYRVAKIRIYEIKWVRLDKSLTKETYTKGLRFCFEILVNWLIVLNLLGCSTGKIQNIESIKVWIL